LLPAKLITPPSASPSFDLMGKPLHIDGLIRHPELLSVQVAVFIADHLMARAVQYVSA